jgi:hypothetical protein
LTDRQSEASRCLHTASTKTRNKARRCGQSRIKQRVRTAECRSSPLTIFCDCR